MRGRTEARMDAIRPSWQPIRRTAGPVLLLGPGLLRRPVERRLRQQGRQGIVLLQKLDFALAVKGGSVGTELVVVAALSGHECRSSTFQDVLDVMADLRHLNRPHVLLIFVPLRSSL
jgi:hypothetical protein